MVVVGSAGSLKVSSWIASRSAKAGKRVVCVCQASNTGTKFSIFTHTLSRKEFFVCCKACSPWPLRIASNHGSHPIFSTAKAKWFKIAGSNSSLAVVNGTWRSEHDLSRQCFQLEFAQEQPSSFVIIVPDVLTIDDTSIESLVSWKPPFLGSSVFLPSTKSRPIASTGNFTRSA